jgi:hypothetical protein
MSRRGTGAQPGKSEGKRPPAGRCKLTLAQDPDLDEHRRAIRGIDRAQAYRGGNARSRNYHG